MHRIPRQLTLLTTLLTAAIASPSAAFTPYVRVDYGANHLRMTDGNARLEEVRRSFEDAGFSPEFERIGPGYGPSGSVGLWVLRGLRLGATYSFLRSQVDNSVHEPNVFVWAEELQFKMTEIGGEAAVRMTRWGGLTLGASAASGRARVEEFIGSEDFGGYDELRMSGERTTRTYGAYLGLDQTNPAGAAGYIRAGYQWRDVGRVPIHVRTTDAGEYDGQTPWLDYSGFYLKLGIGFDRVR